jgi:hypothetical protein
VYITCRRGVSSKKVEFPSFDGPKGLVNRVNKGGWIRVVWSNQTSLIWSHDDGSWSVWSDQRGRSAWGYDKAVDVRVHDQAVYKANPFRKKKSFSTQHLLSSSLSPISLCSSSLKNTQQFSRFRPVAARPDCGATAPKPLNTPKINLFNTKTFLLSSTTQI